MYLLQESNHLAGSPLVWLGQVNVLEIEQKAFTVLGPVHTASVCGDDHAGLAKLLQNVGGVCLSTAVDCSHLH